jgi:hypothetical protein
MKFNPLAGGGVGWRRERGAHRLGLLTFVSVLAVVPVGATDSLNSNGVSDLWEVAYGMFDPSPAVDADGDGQDDATEARNGTNPLDPGSNFRLELVARAKGSRLLQWDGKVARRYRVQSYGPSGRWEDVALPVRGFDCRQGYAVPPAGTSLRFYRLMVDADEPCRPEASELLAGRDSDGDGQSDWVEWSFGSSVIDPAGRFAVTLSPDVGSVSLRWVTVAGADDYLERFDGKAWSVVQGPFAGSGHDCLTAVESREQAAVFRVRRVMRDSDADGVLDWEEHLAGLDPRDVTTADPRQTDAVYIQGNLLRGGVVELAAVQPVIRLGTDTEAVVKLRRNGGLAPLRVPLSLDGEAVTAGWCEVSPLEVTLGLGETEAEIRVRVTAAGSLSGSGSARIGIPPSAAYEIGGSGSRTVTLVEPKLVNVADHGALGNGIADDTQAVQAAIEALEADASANGLYFPAGRYRIATIRHDPDSPLANQRMLKLGGNGSLSGRDILLQGQPGSCLYADPGTTRANLLVALASFRSLSIDNLRFEKSPVPLGATPGHEPNGADGLTVVAQGRQAIEGVLVRNCQFINCHRAISIYGAGYDIRGNGGMFLMFGCEVLNPYGANTLNSSSAWGGGQQLYLAAWVADAVYQNCVFEGGSADLTDPATAPGGRVKDGCHFGSPLRLTFSHNIVRWMGVEAVHQTNETTLMETTLEPFTMPPVGGVATVAIPVPSLPSSWIPGEAVNIRSPAVPGGTPANNRLTVVGHDPERGRVTLANPGAPGNVAAGTQFQANRLIYLDERPEATRAVIEGNLLVGTVPAGGLIISEQAAIVAQAKCRIARNVVLDFGNGVLIRPEAHTPRFPAARAARITDNLIQTRDTRLNPAIYTYGIQVAGSNTQIDGNLVICPASWKIIGVAIQGAESLAWRNTVIADTVTWNGYASPVRAVGIGNGNSAPGLSVWENHTRGFDLGVGPIGANMGIGFRVRDHTSVNDALAIDPRGRKPW